MDVEQAKRQLSEAMMAKDVRQEFADQEAKVPYGMSGMSIERRIEEWFTYHKPSPEQLPKYETLRANARFFAQVIVANTPEGADQTAALRKLRECVMTANSAIACRGI